jgi:hypothetical protein
VYGVVWVGMSPVLTPKTKEPTKPVSYRGPPELVAEIDAAAKVLRLSRNEAMTQLLRAGLDLHRQETRRPKR